MVFVRGAGIRTENRGQSVRYKAMLARRRPSRTDRWWVAARGAISTPSTSPRVKELRLTQICIPLLLDVRRGFRHQNQ